MMSVEMLPNKLVRLAVRMARVPQQRTNETAV